MDNETQELTEATEYSQPLPQLLDAILEPEDAYADLKRKPRWLIFFLVCTAVLMALIPLAQPYNLAAGQEQMDHYISENRSQLGEEQLAQMEDMRENMGESFMFQYLPYIATPVLMMIFILLVATGLNIGVGMTGIKLGFKSALSIASLTLVVSTIGGIVGLILVLVKGDVNVGTNLSLLFPRYPVEWYTRLLKAFASQLDLFAVWAVYLYTVGVSKVTGLSTKRSFRVVFILWLIWALLGTALGYLGFAG